MKKTLRKLKVKKAVLVSLGTGFAFFVTVFFIGYMVIRNYIRKMNVIDRSQEDDYVYAEDYNDNIDIDENVHMIENQVSEAFQDKLSIDDINVDNVSDSTDEDLNFLSEYEKIADIPVMKDKNVFNVLLIGSDSRDPDDRGRSDAMMVLSVSKKNKEIVLTSLLRDIYLNIPGKKSNRLNAAYALGGAKLLTETIENNFKIKLDGYVAVDFIAFLEIIDILGGVTVEVTEEELPFLNSNIRNINMFLNEDTDKDLIPAAGKYLLNGKQTLGYSRIRYAGTDFARTARQRKVLEQIFEK
ncbi:MAG TPA: LCP family protein, partial [Mobilitalea sp.]|nr:LCP family protein [Mobilitalea sp.]